MAIIRIRINGEIVDWVKLSQLDLDNCSVKEKISPSGLASAYEFTCGSYSRKWDQEKPGGKIELEEESAALFTTTGNALKIIKTIPLGNINN